MQLNWRTLLPQPWVGLMAILLAGTSVLVAWLSIRTEGSAFPSPSDMVLAGVLLLMLLLAQWFPIHLRHHSKVHLGSVPLALMAMLLFPPLAGTATLMGMFWGEAAVRKQRGGYWSDVATQVGRWTLCVLLASLVAHHPTSSATGHTGALIAAALIPWLGDILTSPLLLTPITGEAPWTIIEDIARQAGLIEAGQYLVALAGVVVAERHAWALGFLALLVPLLYLMTNPAQPLQEKARKILRSMGWKVSSEETPSAQSSRYMQ